MRPLPTRLYDRARAEAEYGITFKGQPLPLQFRAEPDAIQQASAIGELVGICQWIEKTFDMGADRSQVADPAIIARRDIYAGVLARIAELKAGS